MSLIQVPSYRRKRNTHSLALTAAAPSPVRVRCVWLCAEHEEQWEQLGRRRRQQGVLGTEPSAVAAKAVESGGLEVLELRMRQLEVTDGVLALRQKRGQHQHAPLIKSPRGKRRGEERG